MPTPSKLCCELAAAETQQLAPLLSPPCPALMHAATCFSAAINRIAGDRPYGFAYTDSRQKASALAIKAGTGKQRGIVTAFPEVAPCTGLQFWCVACGQQAPRTLGSCLLTCMAGPNASLPADMSCHTFYDTLKTEDVTKTDIDRAARRVLTARVRWAAPERWVTT